MESTSIVTRTMDLFDKASASDSILQSVTNCILEIDNWMSSNRLKLNLDKMQFSCLGTVGQNKCTHRQHCIIDNTTTTTFVCSLNPIRQTSIPRPYTIISLLSFHHCSSQPSPYLSVSSRAYTRLWNESIEKQRLSPEKRRSQSGTCLFAQDLA